MTNPVRFPSVPLDTLTTGTRCHIVSVNEESESLVRLMEMGLIPGSVVTIERIALLGSPISVRLSGFTLAVRRDDAKQITVKILDESE